MNRDDIIRMANEAGVGMDAQHPGWLLPHLERFAALVAAAEREVEIEFLEWVHPTIGVVPVNPETPLVLKVKIRAPSNQ